MDPRLLLASAALAWALGYIVACAIWPFGDCFTCHGTAQRRSPTGKAFRTCRACKGTGRRVRIGRRIYDHLRTEQRKGNR